MPGQSGSRREVDSVQALLSGSAQVTTFRLLWLALLFYGERVTFHDAANRCQWPEPPPAAPNRHRPAVHVLLVTDPQIIDRDTYPDLPFPSLLYPIIRHFSDNYLKNVWASLTVNPNRWFHRGHVRSSSERARLQSRSRTDLVQPPDAVVWMGDLTDGGRRGRSEIEWAALVERFRRIFWRPREADWEAQSSVLSTVRHVIVPRTSATMHIPTFFLSGNHDVGLPGTSNSGQRLDSLASADAIERFNRDFGMKIDGGGFAVKDGNSFLRSSLNSRILVSTDSSTGATHELVLVNAQDLVGMEREGGGPFDTHLSSDHAGKLDGQLGDQAHSAYKETYEFVEFVRSGGVRIPRVLLTHVPLHRPEGTSCNDEARTSVHGVTRESERPLHQGTDRGSTYQNMVSASVTDWVLQSIDPIAVFSGDDHDHCEYRHQKIADSIAATAIVDGFQANQIPELTVKSISMTEGVRKPGFARLSLFSPLASEHADVGQYVSMAYTPCLLPDQIGIWTQLYLPFFLISLVGLLLWLRLTQKDQARSEYLPLSDRRKRDDDDPPEASGPSHSHLTRVTQRKSIARRWAQDVLAVVAIALPFWLSCQTHFLF